MRITADLSARTMGDHLQTIHISRKVEDLLTHAKMLYGEILTA
jgi:hypothetical protein